jgi:hypothetical protein
MTRRRSRMLLQITHDVSSIGWLGVGLAQLTLNLIALATGTPALRHDAHEITHLFDRWLLSPLALLAVGSGALLATRTRWGLLRYWWIVVKLTLSAALLVFMPVWMGAWAARAAAQTAGPVASGYLTTRVDLLAGSVTVVSTLLFVVVVSVVKPWGRTPRGRRLAGRHATGAAPGRAVDQTPARIVA